jgi:DNA-binding response OmpR family regulator
MSPPLRIAVIDVDSGFLHVLGRRMSNRSHTLEVFGGAVALPDLVSARVNAVVVNLAIVGGAPFAYLEQLCGSLPVVVCTGQTSVEQRVRGLRLGADDWVTKPCHPEELIARVEAVVRRRMYAESAAEPIASGELVIRGDQFQAFVGSASLDLTRREFELISLLAAAEGRVLEREEIYQRVWGYAMARGDRSVDVFVRKLRQKLEKASPGWHYIHTHFGVGYRFAAERAPDAVEPPAPAASPVPDAPPADLAPAPDVAAKATAAS